MGNRNRRFRQLILAIFLLNSLARGQQPESKKTDPSRIDIFAGYTIWIPNGSVDHTPFPNDMHGAILSGAYYFTPNFGLELDSDYHFADSNDSMVSFAVGPIIRRPAPRGFTMFAHALVGAADITGPYGPIPGDKYNFKQLGADWGPTITLGGGLDFRVPYFRHRFSLRLFQADYVFERPDFGPQGIGHLNSGRFSTGVVWNIGSVAPRPPVTLACTATPQSVYPGDPLTVSGLTDHVERHKAVTYRWQLGSLAVSGPKPTAEFDTASLQPGTFTIAGQASEGERAGQSARCAAHFTVMPFSAPTVRCLANPSTIRRGEQALIYAHAASPQNRPLRYTYSTSGGPIVANGEVGKLTATSTAREIEVSCNVADDKGHGATASTLITVLSNESAP